MGHYIDLRGTESSLQIPDGGQGEVHDAELAVTSLLKQRSFYCRNAGKEPDDLRTKDPASPSALAARAEALSRTGTPKTEASTVSRWVERGAAECSRDCPPMSGWGTPALASLGLGQLEHFAATLFIWWNSILVFT